MILTSYFANYRNFPLFRTGICVSRVNPSEFKQALELAPSSKLLYEYKNNPSIDYEEIYRRETLSKLNPKEISVKYHNAILLCFEKSGDFCHRQIIRTWLQENGFKAEELTKETKTIAILDDEKLDKESLELITKKLISNFSKVRINPFGNRIKEFIRNYSIEETKEEPEIILQFGSEKIETQRKLYFLDTKTKKFS